MTDYVKIKNETKQVKFITLDKFGSDDKEYDLKPKEELIIPKNWVSNQINNLNRMKLVTIKEV
tara:strand:+ start:2059 stop:2247 length:189 start_codon:yes stop_codon:yes gene_type:complete